MIRRLLVFLLPVILFLPLASTGLDRPGLHYDEALEAGLPAVHLLNHQPLDVLNNGALRIGDWSLPLMVQNHIGAIQVYAALPFIALVGPNAVSLRAMTVAAGVLTLMAVYLFVIQLYGRIAALAASLWLATFASFVFWSRQGVFVTSLAPCFAMGALAAGAYWWRSRRGWAAGLMGLCTGLAVYSKLSALWLLNGMIAWGLVAAIIPRLTRAGPPPGVPLLRRLAGCFDRSLICAGLGFLLGCWPLLLYNLMTGGATIRVVQINAGQTYLGVRNVDVPGNLQTRFAQAADVIRSGDHLWYLGGSFPNHVALVSVVAALLVIVISVVGARGRNWRSTLLVPFLGLMVIAQSCYTISALWPTHFAIAAPLPAIIFGVAAARLYGGQHPAPAGPSAAWHLRRWSAILVMIAVVCTQLQTSLRYLSAVTSGGGLSFHSAAIYDLSRFLAGRTEHIVALDWGIAAPVAYLTGGRVAVEEFYGYGQAAPKEFGAALQQRFGSDELYLTHAEHQEAFQRRAAFLQAVAAAGLQAEPINVSIRADGWPMLEVWQVHKPSGS